MSRPRDLSQLFPKTSYVVPPRMNLYIKRNMRVNNIFKRYVADEDLLMYPIDEPILKVTRSLNIFTTEGTRSQRRKKFVQMIQERIKEELGLIATVGVAEIIPFGQTRLRQSIYSCRKDRNICKRKVQHLFISR